jgi:hypothetical protein
MCTATYITENSCRIFLIFVAIQANSLFVPWSSRCRGVSASVNRIQETMVRRKVRSEATPLIRGDMDIDKHLTYEKSFSCLMIAVLFILLNRINTFSSFTIFLSYFSATFITTCINHQAKVKFNNKKIKKYITNYNIMLVNVGIGAMSK